MSYIIKGDNMPEKCQWCPCCYEDVDKILSPHEAVCSVYGDIIPDMTAGRIDSCPLIKLPKQHGRLIDADVVYANIDNLLSGDGSKWLAERAVHDAPTVIKAEDGE